MKPGTRFAAAIATLAATALIAACSQVPQRPQEIARDDYAAITPYVTEVIRHEMQMNDIVGVSIALVDDQRVVWADGFGYADQAQKRPASAETLYRVGSISKLFTATAAMQLAEQGKLDIDRPLADVLPGFSIHSRYASREPITPRNIMSHHSGLPRDFGKGMFTRQPEAFTTLVEHLRDSEAISAPNQLFLYSNVGVTLLGHAIQNVAGRPFAEHLQQAVLDPLGMRTAHFEPGIDPSPRMAQPYRRGAAAVEQPIRDVPAGGLNASVLDLSHFLSMVFAEGRAGEAQILRPESIREMLRPQNTAAPFDFNFHTGLGWMLSTLGPSTIQGAGTVAHHAGATVHYRAQLYALPEHKLGVVVLANTSSAGRSVDRIAIEALTLALQAKRGIRQPPPLKSTALPAEWPLAQLQAYVGEYTSLAGHLHIHLDGGQLRADALGRSFNLLPRSDGRLGMQYKLLGLMAVDLGSLDAVGFSLRRVNGREVLVGSVGDQDMLIGERVDPPADITPWRARLGRYEIVNAGDDHTSVDRAALREENGVLVAELAITDQPGPPSHIVLQPLSADTALLLGPLADSGETLRCAVGIGGADECITSGYVLRRVADGRH